MFRLMTSAAALAMAATTAAADYNLTVLHTNDFHSRFEPISKYDSGCSSEDNMEGKCFGGSARLVTAINEARARAENPVLLDGGDQFQGTLFYTYYKGRLAAEMMNHLGYDGLSTRFSALTNGASCKTKATPQARPSTLPMATSTFPPQRPCAKRPPSISRAKMIW